MSISNWRVPGMGGTPGTYNSRTTQPLSVKTSLDRFRQARLRVVGRKTEQRVERGEHDAERRCSVGQVELFHVTAAPCAPTSPPGLRASRSSIDCDESTPHTSSPRTASAHASLPGPDTELEHGPPVRQALDEVQAGPGVGRERVPGVVDVGEGFAVPVDREVRDQFRYTRT